MSVASVTQENTAMVMAYLFQMDRVYKVLRNIDCEVTLYPAYYYF